MVTTFFSMISEDPRLTASIRPSSSAMEAQEMAIAAQELATKAQHEAITAQAVEAGVEMPPTDIDLLRATAEKVKAADQKIIDHACQ